MTVNRCLAKMMKRSRLQIQSWVEFVDARQHARALVGRVIGRLDNCNTLGLELVEQLYTAPRELEECVLEP